MKKRLQGLIAGVLIGTTLTGGMVFAANTTTLYNVLANGIKIVVDGQKLNPTDANGNKVEPIIYNGTTYLPVRAVANALGKAVYWDGPEYTVYLGDMNGKLEYPTEELENMTSISERIYTTDNLTDNYGNSYNRAIYNYRNNIEVLTNMKYRRFRGTLYIPHGETGEHSIYLRIIADGRTIYTSPKMTRSSHPVNIDIDVTGYNDIKFEFNLPSAQGYLKVCIGDAGFYQ